MSGEWKSWEVGSIALMPAMRDKSLEEQMAAVRYELACLTGRFLAQADGELTAADIERRAA